MPQKLGEEVSDPLGGRKVERAALKHRPLVGFIANPLGPAGGAGISKLLRQVAHQADSVKRSNSDAASPSDGKRMRLRLDGVSPNSTASFRKASSAWLATVR